MVALLHPAHLHPAPAAQRTARPRHLRLVTTEAKTAADPLSIVAVVAVMATVLLVVLVRGVQGAPPASHWEGLNESSVQVSATVSAADTVTTVGTVTVLEGDTWASIAARVQPGADPVEFAQSLVSANGGYHLHVGQVLVLSADE